MIPTTLVNVEQLNDSTYTFWLKPSQTINYTAGQFIEIYLPHDADERGSRRWFTLSSSPSEELLAITTRKTAIMSSFKQQLFTTELGETLQISQAMGDFVLPMQRSIPVIFVVRGIGITPVRSMTRQLLDEGINRRNITIIHSVQDNNDLLFKEIYQEVSTITIKRIERFQDDTSELVAQVFEVYKQKPSARIYISGPEQFVEKVLEQLKSSVIKPSDVVTDFFHGYNV